MPGVDVSVRSALVAFGPDAEAPAVVGVDLKVKAGSCHGIVGESASGKTTLVRAILGQLRLKSGSVRVGDFQLPVKGGSNAAAFARTVGWIPQDATGSLDPTMSVWRSVTEGMRIHARLSRTEARLAATRLLEQVGLTEYHLERLPGTLSGGQCQRVCIARAIATGPRLLVADEPLSALDPLVQVQILDLLKDIQAESGVTFIMVSHSIGSVRAFCDEVTVLHEGRAAESGPVEEILANPQHPHTRELIEAERGGWG